MCYINVGWKCGPDTTLKIGIGTAFFISWSAPELFCQFLSTILQGDKYILLSIVLFSWCKTTSNFNSKFAGNIPYLLHGYMYTINVAPLNQLNENQAQSFMRVVMVIQILNHFLGLNVVPSYMNRKKLFKIFSILKRPVSPKDHCLDKCMGCFGVIMIHLYTISLIRW